MALHFSGEEFATRSQRTRDAMASEDLDALLLFSPESQYWLTGYDTFGYCFFQCLIAKADGGLTLLTRAPDLRQARHTSNVETVFVWTDGAPHGPAAQLREVIGELGLDGKRLGIEFDTHGLTAANGRMVEDALAGVCELADASRVVPRLRVVKSAAEIAHIRRAAGIADDMLDAGLAVVSSGAGEAAVRAAMYDVLFSAGGDEPGNPLIVNAGVDALLCRSRSATVTLAETDQITLEIAGTWRHYHAALMRTAVVGEPNDTQRAMHDACREAIEACETVMRPGHGFADVYDAHRRVMDRRGMAGHRLNACGYSLGARFAPSWMEWPMFHAGEDAPIVPSMSLFAHMILMDSDTGTAMTLGRTYLTTDAAPEPLSRLTLDLPRR